MSEGSPYLLRGLWKTVVVVFLPEAKLISSSPPALVLLAATCELKPQPEAISATVLADSPYLLIKTTTRGDQGHHVGGQSIFAARAAGLCANDHP